MPEIKPPPKEKIYWAIKLDEKLVAFGNGEQFQMPIFSTKNDARDWKKEIGDMMEYSKRLSKPVKIIIREVSK